MSTEVPKCFEKLCRNWLYVMRRWKIKPRRTHAFSEGWNGGASRDRTDDLPGVPGRFSRRLEASISSWIDRCDFQLFNCRSRRRASANVLNCS